MYYGGGGRNVSLWRGVHQKEILLSRSWLAIPVFPFLLSFLWRACLSSEQRQREDQRSKEAVVLYIYIYIKPLLQRSRALLRSSLRIDSRRSWDVPRLQRFYHPEERAEGASSATPSGFIYIYIYIKLSRERFWQQRSRRRAGCSAAVTKSLLWLQLELGRTSAPRLKIRGFFCLPAP